MVSFFKTIDVLNLEWPGNERDVNAVAPIILELRRRGYKCVTGDIFSYVFFLLKYRPKVLLITSFQGASINHNLCVLSKKLGIRVVTLIAEGNTREAAIEEMTWGNNKDRLLYFDKMLLWSNRSEALMHRYFPALKGRTSVVGGVGFDRYKRLLFLDKQSFVVNGKSIASYRLVVGLAGWGFDRVHDTEFYRANEKSILANFRTGQRELHINDFIKLQEIYKSVITNNPDVLFILKPHPGLTEYYYDEFKDLKLLDNVYYSMPRECKYSLSDLISVSDIWGGYETTTCLEAWLLEKNTFLLNPSGDNFNRDVTAKGSVILTNECQLNSVINEPEKLGGLNEQNSIIMGKRHEIIEDVIGFDDGKSYLRAVNEIVPVINKAKYPSYNLWELSSKATYRSFFSCTMRNVGWLNKFRKLREIDQFQIEKGIALFDKAHKK